MYTPSHHSFSSEDNKRIQRLSDRLTNEKYPQFLPWKYSFSLKSLQGTGAAYYGSNHGPWKKSNVFVNNNNEDDFRVPYDTYSTFPKVDNRLSTIAYNALRPNYHDSILQDRYGRSLLSHTIDNTYPVLRTGRATLLTNHQPDQPKETHNHHPGVSNGIYYSVLPPSITNYSVHPLSIKEYAVPLPPMNPNQQQVIVPLPISLQDGPRNNPENEKNIALPKINLHSVMLPPLPTVIPNYPRTTTGRYYGDRVLFTPPVHRTIVDKETITLSTSRVRYNDSVVSSSSTVSLDDQLTSAALPYSHHLFGKGGPDFSPGHLSSYSIMTDIHLVSPTEALERIVQDMTPLKVKDYCNALQSFENNSGDDSMIMETIANEYYSRLWKYTIPPSTSLVVIRNDTTKVTEDDTLGTDPDAATCTISSSIPSETTVDLLLTKTNPLKQFLNRPDNGNGDIGGGGKSGKKPTQGIRTCTFPPLLSAPVLRKKLE